MLAILFGLFLIAHGAIHLGYISPAPPAKPGAPEWPFTMAHSWLGLPIDVLKIIGTVLTIVVVVGYILAALGTWGIVIPHDWTKWLVIGSSVASLLLLIMFWHTWLIIGVAIDIALIVWFLVKS